MNYAMMHSRWLKKRSTGLMLLQMQRTLKYLQSFGTVWKKGYVALRMIYYPTAAEILGQISCSHLLRRTTLLRTTDSPASSIGQSCFEHRTVLLRTSDSLALNIEQSCFERRIVLFRTSDSPASNVGQSCFERRDNSNKRLFLLLDIDKS